MEKLNFYKQCDTCQGDAYVIVNSNFNDDPRFDEREDCPICATGKVPNDEVLRDRFDEYGSLLDALRDKITKIENTIEKVKAHKSRLYNKASAEGKKYF